MNKTFLKEKMYESMGLDNRKKKKLKEDKADRKLFKEFKILVDGRLYEVSHTPQRRDEIFKILQQVYPDSEIEVVPYNHYESGYSRKELERIINKQLQEYGVNESLKEDYNSDLEEERKIQKYLNDNKLWGEVEVNDGTVYVEIDWGDWKHEHLRCRYLMNELGYQQDYVEVTEEDGSDCYSAIHTYIKNDMNESLSLKEKYYPFTFYDEEYSLVPLKTTYNNNGTLAIMVYTDDGEPFGDLTVNLPDSDTLADDTHAFVQRDSWVKDFIKQTKLGRPVGKSAKSGFSTFELYEFDINKLDDM